MPQDSHIPFYHTTIRRKLQEVFKIFLRKLCGVKFPSKCNSKCCCCGCLDNLRICLLADVRPAPAVPCGAACLPCRPPALPLACFVAPIPPPALAERSSPPGKGETLGYFMQGAPPLASPRLSRRQHGLNLRYRCPTGGLSGWLPADRATVVSARGACLPCRLLAPAFSFLYCPHPPAPFPSGEGGN